MQKNQRFIHLQRSLRHPTQCLPGAALSPASSLWPGSRMEGLEEAGWLGAG